MNAIRQCISNPLAADAFGGGYIAGIIGDAPSHYSKSPNLWSAAFLRMKIDAVYLPFDVTDSRVGELLAILKSYDRFLGVNVTVPHKVKVLDFIDGLDPSARNIQAVNTIIRTSDGQLVGHNTDGEGFVESLLKRQPDRPERFLLSLKNLCVLLLGAGGSARAVAFRVAESLQGGRLLICNRSAAHAEHLAQDLNKPGCNVRAILESELYSYASNVDLIINSTTKGQGGVRKLGPDQVTLLDAYSALAPANPPSFAESECGDSDFRIKWAKAADADVGANHRLSMELAKSIPADARFYDLIYHPEETVFLRHGRLTGHPTMNGKAMVINQAVLAFERVCRGQLSARGIGAPEMNQEILDAMYRAW